MGLIVVTPPSVYPVTRGEAKLHCRIDGNDEDTLVDGLIAAACDHVALYIGRSVATQTLRLTMAEFTNDTILLRGPVQSVSSVTYYVNGVQQTLASTVYRFDASTDMVHLIDGQVWPTTDKREDAVAINYVAGFTTLPAPIKQSILLLVAHWYDNRTVASERPMSDIPHAVEALLANYRSFAF